MSHDVETLSRLYLELANVVPKDTISSREISMKKQLDRYGLALMMIAEGCANPRQHAKDTLALYGKATP